MSATITLRDIARGVKYVQGEFDNMKPSKAHGKFRNLWESKEVFDLKEFFGTYSDHGDHDEFPLPHKADTRNKRTSGYVRIAEKLFSNHVQNGHGPFDREKFLITTRILYRQGWFFKRKLFRVKDSIYYAFDAPSAIRLMNMLIDKTDEQGREAYDAFLAKILEYGDKHFILEIAW